MNELLLSIEQAIRCCLPETEEEAESLGCAHCPHRDDCRRAEGDVSINERIVEDVRALMKALKPRVLTLEEVKDSIGEAIYFESRGTYMGKVVFPILPALFTSHGLMRYVHPQSSHYSELGLHDYEKVWRCWSARPTDEQRKATPWN